MEPTNDDSDSATDHPDWEWRSSLERPASGRAGPARHSAATYPLWSHPALWALLAVGYCMPGVAMLEVVPWPAYMYLGPVILLAFGGAVVGRIRGWKRGVLAIALMMGGLTAGFLLNASMISF